jgi:hypothetical protein
MATGQGLGNLLPLLAMLAGLVAMVRASLARRARRRQHGGSDREETPASRPDDRRGETERRMASYMAQRDMGRQGGWQGDDTAGRAREDQETTR